MQSEQWAEAKQDSFPSHAKIYLHRAVNRKGKLDHIKSKKQKTETVATSSPCLKRISFRSTSAFSALQIYPSCHEIKRTQKSKK